MVNVKAAVEGLRDAISRLGANLTPDQEGVLQLNVRERRDALSRSISQLSPGTLSVQASRTFLKMQAEATPSLPSCTAVLHGRLCSARHLSFEGWRVYSGDSLYSCSHTLPSLDCNSC